MNTDLIKKAKIDFEKDFKLMDTAIFRKAMENLTKHRDIKLVTAEEKNI